MAFRSLRILSVLFCIMLAACAGDEITEAPVENLNADTTLIPFDASLKAPARPSALMGIVGSAFLAFAQTVRTDAAMAGIRLQWNLAEYFSDSTSNETFALLEEMGRLLEIDVIDLLNRTADRTKTLDAFIASLESIISLSERKILELQEIGSQQKETVSERKKIVRDLEKEMKSAVKEKQYAMIAAKQELISQAQSELSAAESERKETDKIIQQFTLLQKKLTERRVVLSENREILIAGLSVKDVPGAEELGILEKQVR